MPAAPPVPSITQRAQHGPCEPNTNPTELPANTPRRLGARRVTASSHAADGGDARDPENPRGQLSSPKGARDAGRGQSYKNALCFSPCKSRHVLWVGRTRPETKTQRPRERRRIGGRIGSSPLHPLGVRPCTAIPAGCPEQGWAPQKRLCPVRGLSGARGSWKAVTLEEPRASRL